MPVGFPGTRPELRSGGKSSGSGRRAELEDLDGTTKVTQAVFTEVDQLHSVGQLVTQKHLGGAGNDGLAAVGGGHQAGAPIDRQACVAGVVDDHRLVGVQPDPGAQWVCGAPRLFRERLL